MAGDEVAALGIAGQGVGGVGRLQPFIKQEPLASYPANALARDAEGRYLVTGQVPGDSAVHTGTDVPLSAFGPGAWAFAGVIDNTDVFFTLAQAALRGAAAPAGMVLKASAKAAKTSKR